MTYTICGIKISKKCALKITECYVKACEFALKGCNELAKSQNVSDLRKAQKLLVSIQEGV